MLHRLHICTSQMDPTHSFHAPSGPRYANRAKNIKNKPRINEDPKDAMLREFQDEIKRLKAMLEVRRVICVGLV